MKPRLALWSIVGALIGCGDGTESVRFLEPEHVAVRAGTLVDDLAYRHLVLADELRAWNGLGGDEVPEDMVILVWPRDPTAAAVVAAPRPAPSKTRAAPKPRPAGKAPTNAQVVVLEQSAVAVVESAPTGGANRIAVDRHSVRDAGVLGALDGEADAALPEDLVADVDGLSGRGSTPGSAGLERRRGGLGGAGQAEELGSVGRTPRARLGPEIGDAPIRPPNLAMPAAKACLAQPKASDLKSDDGYLASATLTPDQIRSVMTRFAPKTMACIPAGTRGTYEIETQILVGCDGRVKDVWIIHPGAFPANVADCIATTLRYAGFPAHGTPDGVLFAYPIVYRF